MGVFGGLLIAILLLGPVPGWAVGPYVDDGRTVLDRATSLQWQKNAETQQLSWEQALAYCEGLELDGYDDFRVPNVRELMSLIDYAHSPALDSVFTGGSYRDWTSTSRADKPAEAWIVYFLEGDGFWHDKVTSRDTVRCVRGGLPVDRTFQLTLNVHGSGIVQNSLNNGFCTDTCVIAVGYGTSVTLIPRPQAAARFSGWSGLPCGAEDTCTFKVYENMDVSANFFHPGFFPGWLLLR